MHLNTTKRSPHLLFPVHSSLQYSAVVLKFVSSSSSTDSPQHQPASQSVNTRHIPTLSHSNKIEQQNSSSSSISLGERRNCLVRLCLCLCHLSFTSHQPSDTSDTHTATDSLVSLVADNSISIIIIIGRSFVCLFAQCLFFFLLTHSLFGACLSVCVVWCVLLWAAFHFCSLLLLVHCPPPPPPPLSSRNFHYQQSSSRPRPLLLSPSLFTCALIIIILLHQHPPNRVCKNGSHQSLCTSCALSRKLLNVLPSLPPPLPTATSA